MLLTISTTHRPATDLGFLLHKHPARLQEYELPFGKAHVFYPEADEARCTAALLLDVDPIALVRGRKRNGGEGLLTQYVNDRPYVASSFLSVAISRVFGSALGGRSQERPALVDQRLPLSAAVFSLPCRRGEALARRLFEPLGYSVSLDDPEAARPPDDWERAPYRNLLLDGDHRLAELLAHLYVLIPVLDDDKHYWVGDDEVDKLLRRGDGWLADHPERDLITRRYLKHSPRLTRDALLRLTDGDHVDTSERERASEEDLLERPIRLNDIRVESVARVLEDSGATRVVDLGCGEGRLLRELMSIKQFAQVVGVDASIRALEIAAQRLKLERMAPRQRARIELLHGALTYRDARLAGFDAAAVVEVIEHLDPARLESFARVVFEFARPGTVVVTTPNREYNAKFSDFAAGSFRHRDHRFEWTRAEFHAWATAVGGRYGYDVEMRPIGEVDPDLGPPTQMGVFRRCD